MNLGLTYCTRPSASVMTMATGDCSTAQETVELPARRWRVMSWPTARTARGIPPGPGTSPLPMRAPAPAPGVSQRWPRGRAGRAPSAAAAGTVDGHVVRIDQVGERQARQLRRRPAELPQEGLIGLDQAAVEIAAVDRRRRTVPGPQQRFGRHPVGGGRTGLAVASVVLGSHGRGGVVPRRALSGPTAGA